MLKVAALGGALANLVAAMVTALTAPIAPRSFLRP